MLCEEDAVAAMQLFAKSCAAATAANKAASKRPYNGLKTKCATIVQRRSLHRRQRGADLAQRATATYSTDSA